MSNPQTMTAKQTPRKRRTAWVAVVIAALVTAACASQDRYAYLGDALRDQAIPIEETYSNTIMSGDRLYIYVGSQNPTTVVPFNEETNKPVLRNGNETVRTSAKARGYEVRQDGTIEFPVLGTVRAEGYTYNGLARDIEARLVEQRLVRDPTVTVKLMNFHVSVIGEVAKPSVLTADGNRLTIFEAIARCGDITIDGMRTNVTVVRFGNEGVTVDTLDLTSKRTLESDCYYLHQGDIIYVEPTAKKKRRAVRNEEWPHYITMGSYALQIAYLLYYRYAYDPFVTRR